MAEVATLHQPTEEATLPYSIQAEQALLACLLENNQLLDELEGRVLPEHFYLAFNAEVFRTIQTIISKGHHASAVTVMDLMKDKTTFGTNEEIHEHLEALVNVASSTTDVKALSEILYKHFLQREMISIGQELARHAPDQVSLEETETLMNQAESQLFTLAEHGIGRANVQDLKQSLVTVINRAAEARKRKSWLTGVASGFHELDKMLGGLQHSDLIILAARPSMGKTAISVNMAFNAAMALHEQKPGGAAVGFFSLEMSSDQLAARIITGASGIEANRLTQGQIKDEEFDRLVSVSNELANLKIVIDDTPQLHINALRTRARQMKRKHDIGLIVVDYLQLMRGEVGRADGNRVQEISNISQGLKAIARELDVPVIALSQLSRAVESRDNKRPQLSDLRESGSIEQDADIVMFLYREDYYLSKQIGADDNDPKLADLRERLEQVKGITELLVSKNRKGPTGTVKLVFEPEITTFRDYVDTGIQYSPAPENAPF